MRRHRHVITRSGVPAVHTSTTRKSAVPARAARGHRVWDNPCSTHPGDRASRHIYASLSLQRTYSFAAFSNVRCLAVHGFSAGDLVDVELIPAGGGGEVQAGFGLPCCLETNIGPPRPWGQL